ncbi:MFS transporter [Micromonospora aurantiaca]|uniref:MFS transporter n=1 Tax=Micromonospora aurantiaca (nom. illeg.) TaxID=47850 RepID=UPI003456E3AF
MSGSTSWRRPLRNKQFRLLWVGRTVSFAGSAAFPIALTMAVISEEGSATSLGLVLAASAIAEAVFMVVGGVWADRLSRRAVMIVADWVRCAAHVTIGIQMINGVFSTGWLVAAAICTGTASAFFLPASYGLIPATVEPSQLQQANALMSIGRRTAMLTGPVVATSLVLGIGAGWAILLDGLTFAVSAIALMLLRVPEPKRQASSIIADIREGWTEVRSRRWFWSNAVVHGLWNFGRCFYFTIGPVLVITSNGGEFGWGVITQGATVGAFLGAVVALRFRPRRPLVVSNICLALGALPLIAIALELPVPAIALAAVMMNSVLGLLDSLWDTTVQQRMPENLISKVGSYDWVASIALIPVGMAAASPLAELVGAKTILIAAALVMAVPSLAVLALREVRQMETKSTPEVVPEREDDSVPAVP